MLAYRSVGTARRPAFVAVPAHWSHSRFKLGSISVPIDTGVVPWPQAAARRDFPNRYSDNGILL